MTKNLPGAGDDSSEVDIDELMESLRSQRKSTEKPNDVGCGGEDPTEELDMSGTNHNLYEHEPMKPKLESFEEGRGEQPPESAVTPFSSVRRISKKLRQSFSLRDEESVEVDEDDFELPDDVHSMMFLAPLTSHIFWFALFTFCVQVAILWLSFLDLTCDEPGEEDSNVLNVYTDAPSQVVFGQAIALLVVVMSQDDVTKTLLMVSIGLGSDFREFQRDMKEKYPGGGHYWQFWFSNVLRLVEGLLVIVVSFVFIVQSTSVLEIFLNFAALEFVSELDNLAYRVALEGWVGRRLRKIAARIGGEILPAKKGERNWVDCVNAAVLVGILAVMHSGWITVASRQNNGACIKMDACSVLEIKFSDDVYNLPSGVVFETHLAEDEDEDEDHGGSRRHIKGSHRRIPAAFDVNDPPDFENRAGVNNRRAVYCEASHDVDHDDKTLGMFYHCDQEHAWVWTVRAFAEAGAVRKETLEVCKHGWLLKSAVTQAVTLEEVPTDGWRVWTGVLGSTEVNFSCLECQSSLDCGLDRGVCLDNICHCHGESSGPFCNQDHPCHHLVGFQEEEKHGEEEEHGEETLGPFEFTEDCEAYGRHVFISPPNSEGKQEMYVYSGIRWFDTWWTHEEIEEMDKDIHAHWSNLLLGKVAWYSEPTDLYVPTGPLQWYSVDDAFSEGNYGPMGREIKSSHRMECLSVDCSPSSRVCGKMGKCMEDQNITVGNFNFKGGKFVCEEGHKGHHCEFHDHEGSGLGERADADDVQVDGSNVGGDGDGDGEEHGHEHV